MSSSSPSKPTVSLRERKKLKTHDAIQQHALRLFREQGYDDTTIEQIAAAAEVSPSTYFRYFATKEDVVLHDALDPIMLDAFEAQPAELSPIQAMRHAMRSTFAELSAEELAEQLEREHLIRTIPEVRARMLDSLTGSVQLFAKALAKRAGRSADDPAVLAFIGVVIGVGIVAWLDAAQGTMTDYVERIDAVLALLETALPL